jgi:hypothetical protein
VETEVVILIVVAAIVFTAIAVWAILRANQRASLRQRFGPEYERTVDLTDSRRERREAEGMLAERASRRDELEIRELAPATQARFSDRWEQIQAHFVDHPGDAVREADVLVGEVMGERGYPVEDFDTQADLVSVDHPDLVENYREGHRIAMRHEDAGADTEDLRRAFLHYRSLFSELLGAPSNGRHHTSH